MNKLTELESAKLKIAQYQDKLRILRNRGHTQRDGEVKYYRELLRDWGAYAEELEQLECQVCTTSEIILGKTIMANGLFHVSATCPNCGHNLKGSGQWISKKAIPFEVMESLPTLSDYSLDLPPCVVCGERGVELHHWAPKELFPETFELWPTSYLCRKHHAEWHAIITNPFRSLRKQQEKTNGIPNA